MLTFQTHSRNYQFWWIHCSHICKFQLFCPMNLLQVGCYDHLGSMQRDHFSIHIKVHIVELSGCWRDARHGMLQCFVKSIKRIQLKTSCLRCESDYPHQPICEHVCKDRILLSFYKFFSWWSHFSNKSRSSFQL